MVVQANEILKRVSESLVGAAMADGAVYQDAVVMYARLVTRASDVQLGVMEAAFFRYFTASNAATLALSSCIALISGEISDAGLMLYLSGSAGSSRYELSMMSVVWSVCPAASMAALTSCAISPRWVRVWTISGIPSLTVLFRLNDTGLSESMNDSPSEVGSGLMLFFNRLSEGWMVPVLE